MTLLLKQKIQLDEEVGGVCALLILDICIQAVHVTSEQVCGPDTGVQDKQLGWNSYLRITS